MRVTPLLLAALALVAAAAIARAGFVVITECADNACTQQCQNQTITAGQCMSTAAGPTQYTCPTGPYFCNDLRFFMDSACAQPNNALVVNNVCNACQSNFSVSCGALHNAVFVAANCSDAACDVCEGAIIVPFKTCKLVPGFGYAWLTAVRACQAVNFITFGGSFDCSGSQNTTGQFESGGCFLGNEYTCV